MSVFVNGQCWVYKCTNPQPLWKNIYQPDVEKYICKRCQSFGASPGKPTPKNLKHILTTGVGENNLTCIRYSNGVKCGSKITERGLVYCKICYADALRLIRNTEPVFNFEETKPEPYSWMQE